MASVATATEKFCFTTIRKLCFQNSCNHSEQNIQSFLPHGCCSV